MKGRGGRAIQHPKLRRPTKRRHASWKVIAGALCGVGVLSAIVLVAVATRTKPQGPPLVVKTPAPALTPKSPLVPALVPLPPPPQQPPSRSPEVEMRAALAKIQRDALDRVANLLKELQSRPVGKGENGTIPPESGIDDVLPSNSPRAPVHLQRAWLFAKYEQWERVIPSLERAAELDETYRNHLEDLLEYVRDLPDAEARSYHLRSQPYTLGREKGLGIRYEFKDSKGFSREVVGREGAARLTSGADLFLTGESTEDPLSFRGAVSIRMAVVPRSDFTLLLFHSEKGGLELQFGTKGLVLRRREAGGETRIGETKAHTLGLGAPQEIVVQVHEDSIRIFLGGKEALALPIGAPPSGKIGFRISQGNIELRAPFLVRGGVDSAARDAGTKAFRRFMVDPDLLEIEWNRYRRSFIDPPKDRPLLFPERFDFYKRMYPAGLTYDQVSRDLLWHVSGVPPRHLSPEFTLEGARKKLDLMISTHGAFPPLYYLRGLIHLERGEYERALEDAELALQMFDQFPEALVLKSRVLRGQRRFKEAKECVDRAIQALPDHAPAYVEQAVLSMLDNGAADGIDQDLKLAVKLDRDNLEARLVRARRRLSDSLLKGLGCRTRHTTPRSEIYTDLDAKEAEDLGRRIERAYPLYEKQFKDLVPPATRTPRVAVFGSTGHYDFLWELLSGERGEHTSGVYFPDVNLLAVRADWIPGATDHTLFHELFHEFMNRLPMKTPPFWYNEGMAEYMAGLATGRPVPGRLADVQAIIAAGSALSFEAIMCESPSEFYGTEPSKKYAQSWSMVHFLQKYKEGVYRERLNQYLRRLVEGRSPRAAFQTVFGGDCQALQGEWEAFTKALR